MSAYQGMCSDFIEECVDGFHKYQRIKTNTIIKVMLLRWRVTPLITLIALSLYTNLSAQSIKLPLHCNVYPDTFAILWRPDRSSLNEDTHINITLAVNNGTGSDTFELDNANDTLVLIPFNPAFINAESIEVRATYKAVGKRSMGNPVDNRRGLKVIHATEKLEALIALVDTDPIPYNLLMLADAFEEKRCFANALYVYKQIIMKDTIEGIKQWRIFYKRNYSEFNFVEIRR